MNQISDKRRKEIGWGVFASVVLHVAAVALFLVKLPDLQSPPEEETVNVDLVPPPGEKAPEEKRKEEAQKPPPKPVPPPEPAKPPEAEESQAENPAARRSALSPARPVFEFGPKNTGPRQSEGNALVSSGKPGGVSPAEQPQTDTQQAKSPAKQPAARPVPQDVVLPEVDVAEVHPEKDGPETKGTEESKTELEPAKPPNEVKPPETQTTDLSTAAPLDGEKLTAAKTLFTQDDPRIRTAIGNLSPTRRVEELCRTELEKQLYNSAPEYRPEIVPTIRPRSGTVLDVRDAFRARGRWYDVRFRCEVDADATKVVSFSYAIGDAVPKSEWKSRRFPLD